MCNVLCSKNKLIGKEKPLQARVERWILLKRNRASCFGSSRASITVETSLVFLFYMRIMLFYGISADGFNRNRSTLCSISDGKGMRPESSRTAATECKRSDFFRYMKAVPYVRILLMAGREEFQYILLY